MSEQVALPSGGWFRLCEPGEITERRRRMVQVASHGLSDPVLASLADKDQTPEQATKLATSADIAIMMATNDAIAAAAVAEWSFAHPVTADSLLDLAPADYEALTGAVQANPDITRALLGVDFSPKVVDGQLVADSPT